MARRRRLRWTLVALLWVWALCVFTIVDLFLNVEAFDSVRPRSPLYRGMRVSAHKLVGEPVEGYEPDALPAVQYGELATLTDRIRVLDKSDRDELKWQALHAQDARMRIAALGGLARRYSDRGAVMAAVRNPDENLKVRRHAARMLVWTGAGSQSELEVLMDDTELPYSVRGGAVLGLGELGSASATERLLTLAAGGAFRREALEALARLSTNAAGPLLREAALDPARPPETRRAACRALSRIPDPATVAALSVVLHNPDAPSAVRAMAADSLGRLGDPHAGPVVAAATRDADPIVARQALLASTRLTHLE